MRTLFYILFALLLGLSAPQLSMAAPVFNHATTPNEVHSYVARQSLASSDAEKPTELSVMMKRASISFGILGIVFLGVALATKRRSLFTAAAVAFGTALFAAYPMYAFGALVIYLGCKHAFDEEGEISDKDLKKLARKIKATSSYDVESPLNGNGSGAARSEYSAGRAMAEPVKLKRAI